MNKKYIYIMALTCISMLNTSCEKDLPLYDYQDNMLNMSVALDTDGETAVVTPFSFVYDDEEVRQDTIWLTVSTIGFLSDKDREFELEQIPSEKKDAKPGIDYKSFDDIELRKKYFIPANEVSTKVPIVVLRNDDLKNEEVFLNVSIKENENFKQGYMKYRVAQFSISDRLSRPSAWGTGKWDYMVYQFGVYSVQLHQLLIDATGFKWDDDFINSLQEANDYGYIKYIKQICNKKLDEINAQRIANGEDVLCDDNGKPIEL